MPLALLLIVQLPNYLWQHGAERLFSWNTSLAFSFLRVLDMSHGGLWGSDFLTTSPPPHTNANLAAVLIDYVSWMVQHMWQPVVIGVAIGLLLSWPCAWFGDRLGDALRRRWAAPIRQGHRKPLWRSVLLQGNCVLLLLPATIGSQRVLVELQQTDRLDTALWLPWASGLMVALPVLMLATFTRVRAPREASGTGYYCFRCGYPIDGISLGRQICSECGPIPNRAARLPLVCWAATYAVSLSFLVVACWQPVSWPFWRSRWGVLPNGAGLTVRLNGGSDLVTVKLGRRVIKGVTGVHATGAIVLDWQRSTGDWLLAIEHTHGVDLDVGVGFGQLGPWTELPISIDSNVNGRIRRMYAAPMDSSKPFDTVFMELQLVASDKSKQRIFWQCGFHRSKITLESWMTIESFSEASPVWRTDRAINWTLTGEQPVSNAEAEATLFEQQLPPERR